jgi:hypothetical protein
MKNITIIILTVFFMQLSLSQTMYIHTRSNGIDSINILQIDSITFSVSAQTISLELANWKCYVFPHCGTLIPGYVAPASGVFEKVSEGLKIYGSGYRTGSLIHYAPTTAYSIANKTIYMKWKANGGGNFMAVGVWLGADTADWTVREELTNLTTDHSYAGSYQITDSVWYFTRVVLSSSSYTATTSAGNYDNLGGTIVQTKTDTLGTEYRFPIFFLCDTYAGSTPYAILGEIRIE